MSKTTQILVVDDEEGTREILRDILNFGGFEVAMAANGLAAFDILSRNSDIKVVVSDVRMPDGDGLELMKKIHNLKGKARPSVILLTGFSDVLFEEARRHGVAALIPKPFSSEDILSAVKSSLANAKTTSAA